MQAYRKTRIEKFSHWNLTYTVKYKRDRRNEQNNQQHSQLRWQWQYLRIGSTADGKALRVWQLVRLGCNCRACYAHLELISQLNPERYVALTNPPMPDEPIFYKPKQLHPSVANRKRIAKSINRFAIQ